MSDISSNLIVSNFDTVHSVQENRKLYSTFQVSYTQLLQWISPEESSSNILNDGSNAIVEPACLRLCRSEVQRNTETAVDMPALGNSAAGLTTKCFTIDYSMIDCTATSELLQLDHGLLNNNNSS